MSPAHSFLHKILPRALRGAGRAAGLVGLAAALYATVGGAVTLLRETRRFREASSTLYRRWTRIPAVASPGMLRIHARLRDVMTNAEPIVLVHGLGIGSSYFVPLAARLSRHAPVYAPDLPGHGSSDRDARPLDIAELARSLAAWMEAMGLRHATLVGHALGCQVVAHAVADRPELASRVVLLGPSMTRDRVEDILPRLPCPVFVVRGDRDRIVSQRWAEEVARLARAPEPMVVRGWGHAVHYDEPDKIAALIVALGIQGGRERRSGPPRT